MRGDRISKLLWAGIIILTIFALLYFGYCTGAWGKRGSWLHYRFQCSCPQLMENIRIRKLYSEHAEITFSACDNVGPIPSPSGQKIAVINYSNPNKSYVWFLQTGKKMRFTWPHKYADLIWLSDDLLLVYYWSLDVNVVDLNTRTECPIPVRTDVRPLDGEIVPSVLSALREAEFVILTRGADVIVISPDALVSPECSFVIPSDATLERVKQFLRDQGIDYMDYSSRGGTDVLYGAEGRLVSPDGRFFYCGGICLVETGEKIVDSSPSNCRPVAWVYDGMLLNCTGEYLYYITDLGQGWISEPWLKLRVPAEYDVSDERTVDVSDRLPITFQMLVCFGVALIVAGGIQRLRQRKRQLSERSETQ